jgi:hypothetical protein
MKSRHLWLPSLALAAAGGWLTASLFALPARGKEPRFPQLTMEQLNEQQRPLGEQVMKVSSVGLAGPYNPMMRSPVLGQRLFDLFHYLRWETSVPIRHPDHRPAMALADRMVCACAAGAEGRPLAADHRRAQGQSTPLRHGRGRGCRLRLRHRDHDKERSVGRDLFPRQENI